MDVIEKKDKEDEVITILLEYENNEKKFKKGSCLSEHINTHPV